MSPEEEEEEAVGEYCKEKRRRERGEGGEVRKEKREEGRLEYIV